MVHFYIINPIQKLRQLARCWSRGSKSAAQEAPPAPQEERLLPEPSKKPLVIEGPTTALRRDEEYYASDAEGGFCVFVVEDTLFRIHKCYLLREPSAFADMLSLPQVTESQRAESQDAAAIPLSDTAAQFRDLLWAIYAPPSKLGLYNSHSRDNVPIERLLNIAELAIKYCISSYEDWAIARIYQLANGRPSSLPQIASQELCARTLNVSILSGHRPLRKLVENHLISSILWSADVETRDILRVAVYHSVHTVCGAIHYRYLLDHLKQAGSSDDGQEAGNDSRPNFSSIVNASQRQSMELACSSLVASLDQLSCNAPTLRDRLCPKHGECVAAWTQLWIDANRDAQCSAGAGLQARVNILCRLKAVALYLRTNLPGERRMSVTCTLTALEAVVGLRDEIISNLIHHFYADYSM